MTAVESLLEKGYFPIDLPSAFYTETFANAIALNRTNLPPEMQPRSGKHAQIAPYSVCRLGLSRRQMAIPNPIPFLILCHEIESNWNELYSHCERSSLSASSPTIGDEDQRALRRKMSFEELPPIRSRIRATSRYLLQADISQCYPSIYTHSIPWALHGKVFAKANIHNRTLLGNQLDICVRNCQDRQTMGIPIGPDTSHLFAEIVLTSADHELIDSLGPINGLRYMDDYEIGFHTFADAEKALSHLEQVLNRYELRLNYRKTRITDALIPLEDPWVAHMRRFRFRSEDESQRTDLIDYFTLVMDLALKYPSESVLNYSIARLRSLSPLQPNWDLIQDFLLQVLMQESGTFTHVLEALMRAHDEGCEMHLESIREVMNYQIRHNATSGRGSEVALSLWGLIFWSLPISEDVSPLISEMEDPFVALLALDANQRSLPQVNIDTTNWEPLMNRDALYGPQWILAYEANIKDWLPSTNGADYVAADPNFGFLKNQGVEFYRSDRLITIRPKPISGTQSPFGISGSVIESASSGVKLP